MRKIELKTVPMGEHLGRKWPDLNYGDAICEVLDAKEGGLMAAELRQCSAIIHRIREATDHVLLEEADWAYLRDRINNHRFVFTDDAFVGLLDAVDNAPAVAVAEVPRQQAA